MHESVSTHDFSGADLVRMSEPFGLRSPEANPPFKIVPRWFMALDGDRQQLWFFQPDDTGIFEHTRYRCERCAVRFDHHPGRCARIARVMFAARGGPPPRPNPSTHPEHFVQDISSPGGSMPGPASPRGTAPSSDQPTPR